MRAVPRSQGLGHRGHRAIGLDGAARFTTMARAYSGCEVGNRIFSSSICLDSYFDDIFANATLFHVPSQELPRVLLDCVPR
jgi:hypothetical protein